MIRIKLNFIKTKVDPLVQHYRSDLHQFCHERAHAFDYLRELLNIYFQKPVNNMGFKNLNVSSDSLTFLESLRQEFEQLYHVPQRTRVSHTDVIPANKNVTSRSSRPTTPISLGSSISNETITTPITQIPPIPTTITPPPPKPIWNNITGIWEIPEPEPVQVMIPPKPVWNTVSERWELPIEQPIRETPEGYISPQPTYPSEEEVAAIIGEEKDEVEILEPVVFETVKMRNIKFDPAMFVPIQTNSQLDDYMSLTHGIMPATNIMVQGPAGSGKSSVLIDIACKIKKHDPKRKILFVSGEMTEIDMKGLVDRFEGFEELDILFLNKYTEVDTRELLDQILSIGWDMVMVDSFSEVLGSIIDTGAGEVNTKSGEKWLINQFLKHNLGGNEANLPTMFFFILQVGKDGKFVGSNRIKHAATAFMNIEFTTNQNLFIYFSKNRRGETYNNLYFEHHSEGIHYDFEKYNQDIEIRDALKRAEVENKSSWGKLLKENNDDNNTTITIKDEEEATVSDARVESLQGAIATFDPDGPGQTVENEEEESTTPPLDEAVIPNRRQVNLNDMIEEVENENPPVIKEIDTDELDERVDEIIEELGIPDNEETSKLPTIVELKAKTEAEEKEIARLQAIEDGLPFFDSAEEQIAAEARNKEKEDTEIDEDILKSIDLNDDKEEEKEVIDPTDVDKNPPEDNPNSDDFINLVEL